MQKLNGLEAASLYQQSDEERNQGVPPHWNTYFTVSNTDEVVAKVREANGTVLFGPMDVLDHGQESGGYPEEFNSTYPEVVLGKVRGYINAGP